MLFRIFAVHITLGIRRRMSSIAQHYSSHLAPVYLWMVGGIEAALKAGTHDIEPYIPGPGIAVDLGAGFGMHSIPLAGAGYEVTAVDTSAFLLSTLSENSTGLPIRVIEEDLLKFRDHMRSAANLIICMGDTLTHLESIEQVVRLSQEVRKSLAPGGKFVATFRDYSNLPNGEARFIPVRSDSDRILTCFLEPFSEHLIVHDLLHERDGSSWKLKVSSYRKLRLSPSTVERIFTEAVMVARVEVGPRGMVRLTADA